MLTMVLVTTRRVRVVRMRQLATTMLQPPSMMGRVNLNPALAAQSDACNYDDTATIDDDSCVLVGDSCDDGDDATVKHNR